MKKRGKPALLVDVDGVLCPWGCLEPPPGYVEHEGHDILVSDANADRLARLAQQYELVWATAWEHHANEVISPAHRLGSLAVIEFGTQRLNSGQILLPPHASMTSTWKLPWVVDWAKQDGRPLAWIDDDLGGDAFAWASERDVPTLLCKVEEAVGLTDAIVDELEAFADELTGAGASKPSTPRN